MFTGTIESIHIVRVEGGAPEPRDTAVVREGRGIEGDRYFEKNASGDEKSREAHVTLIEAEAIEAVAHERGLRFAPGSTRRNVITRGVPLNHLVGKEFIVGGVRLLGKKLCEPCGFLAKMTSPEFSKALVHRGGLRAEVVSGGEFRVGDEIRLAGN